MTVLDLTWLVGVAWLVPILTMVFILFLLKRQALINSSFIRFMGDWRKHTASHADLKAVELRVSNLLDACTAMAEELEKLKASSTSLEDATKIRLEKINEHDTRLTRLESFVEDVKERAKALRESKDEMYKNIKSRMAR